MASADHVALLVHQCAHNEGPLKTAATALDGGGRNHRRGKPALHVGSATSPDAAVGNVCSKRRMSLRGGITFGDDDGVAFEAQRPPRTGPAEPAEALRTAGR